MGDFSFKSPNQAAIDAAAQLIDHMERKGFDAVFLVCTKCSTE